MQKIVLHVYKELILTSVLFCLWMMGQGQETRLFNAFTGELNPAQHKLVNTLNSHLTTKRTRVATIQKSVFEQNEITTNLFDDQSMLFTAHDIGQTGVNYRTWTGNSSEYLGSAAVIINGDRISAHFTSVEGSLLLLVFLRFLCHRY